MRESLQTLVLLAIVVAVAAAGFWLGPVAAAVVAGGVGCILVLAIGQRWAMSGERRPPRTAAAATALDQETVVIDPMLDDWKMPIFYSIMLHAFAAVVLNVSGVADKVAPDNMAYKWLGTLIAESWINPAVDPSKSDPILSATFNPMSLYQWLNGVVAFILRSDVSIPMGILNGIIATFAACFSGWHARSLYGSAAGRKAFLLCAFMPSFVLWTSINLKDALGLFAMAGALYGGHNLREHVSPRHFFSFLFFISLMPFIRPYMLVLVLGGMMVSFMIVRFRNLPGTIGACLMVILAGKLLIPLFGDQFSFFSGERLARLTDIHNGLAVGGNSSYDQDIDLSTPERAIAYLPLGIARFMLSPFPWTIRSVLQAAAFPENIFLYYVLYQSVAGIARDVRVRISKVVMPLFVAGLLTISYGLAESNEGTGYRHRAQVLIILFIFAASRMTRPATASGVPHAALTRGMLKQAA